VKVLNEYPTHHYMEEYCLDALYCPDCGKQQIWAEQSPGDYYCGPIYLCAACGCNFTIQGPHHDANDKRIDQIRSGITATPTTPVGH